ncbi:MAG TPA: hypothetical protein VGB63_16825 [Pedobacter sp.]|jgi:hypothetical protein
MSHSNQYPPIDQHTSLDSPFIKLKEIFALEFREELFENSKALITTYTKGFWGRKKDVEAVIEKVDVDPSLYNYNESADHRFIGLTIFSKGREVYKSLYNLGVFDVYIETFKTFHEEKTMEIASISVLSGDLVYHMKETNNMLALRNFSKRLGESLFGEVGLVNES